VYVRRHSVAGTTINNRKEVVGLTVIGHPGKSQWIIYEILYVEVYRIGILFVDECNVQEADLSVHGIGLNVVIKFNDSQTTPTYSSDHRHEDTRTN
jgi:hypothetical protein